MLERDIERHLVKRVKELGGECRKVQWVGHSGAPDRLVMLPLMYTKQFEDETYHHARIDRTIWVELKNPGTVAHFPGSPHERAQHREHERMRAMGQRVEVIGTIEQVEELLR